MLEQVSRYLQNAFLNHIISRFLMVHKLIQSLKSISALVSSQVLLHQYLLELWNGSVVDSNCDLQTHGDKFTYEYIPGLNQFL
jgi:hypothetical protein